MSDGLPLPGRELDAWVAEHVMGWYRWPHKYDDFCFWDYDGPVPVFIDDDERGGVLVWTGKHASYWWQPSTTHAFFQVMEAKKRQHVWRFTEALEALYVVLEVGQDLDDRHWDLNNTVSTSVLFADYPSREKAYAHAVCCCCYLWKTQQ